MDGQRRLVIWWVFLGDWYVPLGMAGFELRKNTVSRTIAFRDNGTCGH